jgi:hypothetical protein
MIENPLIGHKAPSVQQFLKGKRGLATKTTSNKKRQRTIGNSASAIAAPIPDVSIMAADLVQAIQIFLRSISMFYYEKQ